MTDNEIKKALEICAKHSENLHHTLTYEGKPLYLWLNNALDLINRQQAEIERFKKALGTDFVYRGSRANGKTQYISELIKVRVATIKAEAIKAEAIKEFAERLNKRMGYCDLPNCVVRGHIDILSKEMVGES